MNSLLTGKKLVQHHERSRSLLKTIGRTVFALCVVAWMFPSASAHALSGYLSNFETAYPAARGSRIDSCSLCHTSFKGREKSRQRGAAALRAVAANHSFSAALAALDSDADTYSNSTEIAALTFPGDKLDHPVAPPADTVAPVVSFTLPTTATSLSVSLTFSATDSVAVTGYLLSESTTKPLPSDTRWLATPQASFTFPAAGSRTLNAWAKDAAGNVSTVVSRSVVITLPPTPDLVAPVVSFTLPATATTLGVSVSCSATTVSWSLTPGSAGPRVPARASVRECPATRLTVGCE